MTFHYKITLYYLHDQKNKKRTNKKQTNKQRKDTKGISIILPDHDIYEQFSEFSVTGYLNSCKQAQN